ncbi:MAG: hypothetical protein A2W61_02090 [Deltaproteobacteria bacterium RIFCSPLOWO2_01_44_7]|nr:MAG: hypothetical protein A2712_11075 [Deltaproteobacteria bacterium RIFCSPHIGHO2_01_FULL_43_49]OGQ16593.1 MAG: hypothetical protein A3D22_06775 [Deltaproteobacteria bacterium RIFCSPHIGHO2_02_FULL_44_53]OGQ28409.1 MAG: hypothetical protein A3D98_06480 [Deltaproteobacteria bacterium RIFCSPHIGHO2_12_FULL_44_21]OGQ32480.1 MAG: hypothetical protein A2979_11040 [Deltaproteobacteria bacterium RIFCSPLOWO2_01_FULL_45_74]OGQ41606.1 MAG: hypothetical protein A3I70_05385 [Deltaproteobacteria bacterium 
MALDLLIVRHGQTDWNPTRKVMGQNSIGINARGIQQAQNLKEWLKPISIDAVYSSPMPRALQTAEIVIEGRNNLEVQPEKGLAEIDYGDWVGLNFDEVEERYNEIYNAYRFKASKVKIPGGEAVVDVQKRVVASVEKIRTKHQDQKVLIVSHADVIKAMLLHYLKLPLDHLQAVGCDNGSLSIYRFGTDWGDRLVALNYFADVSKVLPW